MQLRLFVFIALLVASTAVGTMPKLTGNRKTAAAKGRKGGAFITTEAHVSAEVTAIYNEMVASLEAADHAKEEAWLILDEAGAIINVLDEEEDQRRPIDGNDDWQAMEEMELGGLNDADDNEVITEGRELEEMIQFAAEEVATVEAELKQKFQKWRSTGTNTGIHGAGTSRASYFRAQKQERDLAESAKGSRKITDFYAPETTSSGYDTDEEMNCPGVPTSTTPKYTDVSSALEALLETDANVTRNVVSEKRKGLMGWEVLRANAVARYFQLREEGKGKMEASAHVAENTYFKKGRDSYKARSIRGWADDWLREGKFQDYVQGQHVKTETVITQEGVQAMLRGKLRKMNDEDRTPEAFMTLLNSSLLSEIDGAPTSVCAETARRWMIILDFRATKAGKGYYVDAHEREDIVQYRQQVFLPRLLELEQKMRIYHGDNMENFTDPTLKAGEKRVVLITHDESTFNCSMARRIYWMEGKKRKCLPKCKGQSIMVSGFVCDCHGFMIDPDDSTNQSFCLFEAGTGTVHNTPFSSFEALLFLTSPTSLSTAREGWWDTADMASQVEKMIPLAQKLHPDCHLVLALDNSMNHHGKAPDGLDVKHPSTNLSDGGKNQRRQIRDGWFINAEGEKVVQRMHHYSVGADDVEVKGNAKGLATILQERGLFTRTSEDGRKYNLCKQCHSCQQGTVSPTYPENCCATKVLSLQPDFAAQKAWVQEICDAADVELIFYPKYHCELNYVEMVWAYEKNLYRRLKAYSYSELKAGLPGSLKAIPLSFIRKAKRHCFRYMSGYRHGLKGPQLDYAARIYSSHRAIPGDKINELLREYGLKQAHGSRKGFLPKKPTVAVQQPKGNLLAGKTSVPVVVPAILPVAAPAAPAPAPAAKVAIAKPVSVEGPPQKKQAVQQPLVADYVVWRGENTVPLLFDWSDPCWVQISPWANNSCAFDSIICCLFWIYLHIYHVPASRSVFDAQLPSISLIFTAFIDGKMNNNMAKDQLFALIDPSKFSQAKKTSDWNTYQFCPTTLTTDYIKDYLVPNNNQLFIITYRSVWCCPSCNKSMKGEEKTMNMIAILSQKFDCTTIQESIDEMMSYHQRTRWCPRCVVQMSVQKEISSYPLILHLEYSQGVVLPDPISQEVQFGSRMYDAVSAVWGDGAHFISRYRRGNQVFESDGMVLLCPAHPNNNRMKPVRCAKSVEATSTYDVAFNGRLGGTTGASGRKVGGRVLNDLFYVLRSANN